MEQRGVGERKKNFYCKVDIVSLTLSNFIFMMENPQLGYHCKNFLEMKWFWLETEFCYMKTLKGYRRLKFIVLKVLSVINFFSEVKKKLLGFGIKEMSIFSSKHTIISCGKNRNFYD